MPNKQQKAAQRLNKMKLEISGQLFIEDGDNVPSEDFDPGFGCVPEFKAAKLAPPDIQYQITKEEQERRDYFFMTEEEKQRREDEFLADHGII